MHKKNLLLIVDDEKVVKGIKEALGTAFEFHKTHDEASAANFLAKQKPDLILLDYDLKGKNGLQVFRELNPAAKVIMFSASNSIPLAVSATKLGVVEFLRKPIDDKLLQEAVRRNMVTVNKRIVWQIKQAWLKGNNIKQKKTIDEVISFCRVGKDIVLLGEAGIDKKSLADFIHINGPKSGNNFVSLDLAAFGKPQQEMLFWTTVQKIMSIDNVKDAKTQCGTLYLSNLEKIDPVFRETIFDFFAQRKGRIDKTIRAVLGVKDRAILGNQQVFAAVNVLPLRERRDDLPGLLNLYLQKYCQKYNKQIKHISGQVLGFLAAYDFPGNYFELARMIEQAVIKAKEETLDLESFPISVSFLSDVITTSCLGENLTLIEAQRSFEKQVYDILLAKTGGDQGKVARFLDVPKSVFSDRLEHLA